MKIRKAHLDTDTYSVYIHENKKEEQTLVAIPSIKWSTIIPYEEDKLALTARLEGEFTLEGEKSQHLALKLVQWVREM